MIGGAQPKVLLSQAEDGTLHLDELFQQIYGKEQDHYKLVRERDGLTKTSVDVKWLEFGEDGRYKADFQEVAVGRSLLMSPFGPCPFPCIITASSRYVPPLYQKVYCKW